MSGVPPVFDIKVSDVHGELFGIPQPDELVFILTVAEGEVFRSGCCFYRGGGRIFYFSPGDQEYRIYHYPMMR
jgi:trehalose utilization protein